MDRGMVVSNSVAMYCLGACKQWCSDVLPWGLQTVVLR